jgi:hypothetical protein
VLQQVPRTANIWRLRDGFCGYGNILPSAGAGGLQGVLEFMSVLLLVVGAIVTMIGVGMAGYGIPINEFSFGNTLIMAGTTATVGGLVIVAIGIAVGELRRLTAAMAALQASPSHETFAAAAGALAGSPPSQMPHLTEFETGSGAPDLHAAMEAPALAEQPEEAQAQVAPTLPNPELPAVALEQYEVAEYERVSLSPQEPAPAPAGAPVPPLAEKRGEPAFDAPWRSSPPPASPAQAAPPRSSPFDNMWPSEPRPASRRVAEKLQPEPPPAKAAMPEPAAPPAAKEPPVAILKSGVVDGMGYTLYVDGSIEAELPQGTLRFASINDLRNHLAKNP